MSFHSNIIGNYHQGSAKLGDDFLSGRGQLVRTAGKKQSILNTDYQPSLLGHYVYIVAQFGCGLLVTLGWF